MTHTPDTKANRAATAAKSGSRSRRAAIVLALLLGVTFFGIRTLAIGALIYAPNHGKPAAYFALAPGEEHAEGADPAVQIAIRVEQPANTNPITATGGEHGTIFILHGIRDHKESLQGWANTLQAAGYATVLVDHRGQGHSTGEYFSYGINESKDLTHIADQLTASKRIKRPIGVLGVSYGAATALQWAETDSRIGAVVAVAPFADLPSMVGNFSPVPLPNWFVAHIVHAGATKAGFQAEQIDSARSASHTYAHLLLLHGEQDKHIPIEHSRRICGAAPGHCTLIEVAGADHPGIFDDTLTHLSARAPAFFAEHMPHARPQ